MYIGISDISFHVSRIGKVGSLPSEFEKYWKNQHIYSCASFTNTCVIEAIYFANNEEEYKSLKGYVRSIVPRIKAQYQALFNKPFPEDWKGCDLKETLKLASTKYRIKFAIYNLIECAENFNPDSANVGVDWVKVELTVKIGEEDSTKTVNLLLLSTGIDCHVCFIKNVENLTKCHICPKCNNYMSSASDHGSYQKKKFEGHVANCDGKNIPQIHLENYLSPYVPHFQKNQL
jgi:hypothetical protein